MHLFNLVSHTCSHSCSYKLHLLKFFFDSWTTHSERYIFDGMTEGRDSRDSKESDTIVTSLT